MKKWLVWIPALLVGYMIIGFSAQDGDTSGGLSRKAASVMVDFAGKTGLVEVNEISRECYIEAMQLPIRKAAHMTEYMIFTFSVLFGLYYWRHRGLRWLVTALLVTFVFAALDEFHQTFVPGRCGQFVDVLIDTAGGAIAVICTAVRNQAGKCRS